MVPQPGAWPDPPVGARVRVELRDTTMVDAPSRLVAAADTDLRRRGSGLAAEAVIEADDADIDPRADLSLWARISVAGALDGPVVPGDWITVQSWPVRPGTELTGPVPIEVRLVY